jgi:hypothetical protein
MTNEQFNSISDKLDKILEKLQSTSSRTQPKTGENAPRSDSKTLTGQARWVEEKQGKKGVFIVFKLIGSEDGDVACNIWDVETVQRVMDGMKVRVSGYYSKWGNYQNFTVKTLSVLENSPTPQQTEDSSELPADDDIPF